MAADLDFFFDPVCPWAWITSRWVTNVAEQRSYDVDWRFISLWIVNEENTKEWYTPEYRAGHYRGHQGLRIADAIRADPGATPMRSAAGTRRVGTALHVETRRDEADSRHRSRSSRSCSRRTGSTPASSRPPTTSRTTSTSGPRPSWR